ncbi:MAG TPA: cupin-like domain-containing protein [Kofleriaceae bacterium]|nr:cupin-like domain-containing protein [Kofleriaceae bacterium]
MPTPRIHLDPATFDPWKIQGLTHALADHPLLQIDALVELGKRQQDRKLVRTHSSDATAGTSFAEAPNLHPNTRGAAATLADIEKAQAWMSLLNVQADPLYRRLIDEVLDEVRPIVDPRDPGMCYRAGWIFVSSPGAVTPFHIDHEHNFILQIRGKKRLYTWDPFDRVVVSERAQELFHDQHSRELVIWKDEWRQRARVFDLEPGMGGYMPSTTPHMVENGDGPSITMSFTYYTDATRQRELIYRGNARLRRLGLDPLPVGTSPGRDQLKHAVLSGFNSAKTAVRRALGKKVRDTRQAYAPEHR